MAESVRDPFHPNPFKTRRGEYVPAGALLGLPRAAVERALGRYAPVPWMAPSAVARLDVVLRPSSTLLELGSGRSTAWYARRCAAVTSVEPNDQWATEVER